MCRLFELGARARREMMEAGVVLAHFHLGPRSAGALIPAPRTSQPRTRAIDQWAPLLGHRIFDVPTPESGISHALLNAFAHSCARWVAALWTAAASIATVCAWRHV